MTPQRGYLVPGLAIALAVAGLALWLTFNRLSACHEARATERAQFEQKLDEYDKKLAEQEASIKKWEEKATTASQAARVALEAARVRGKGLEAEAARLRTAVKAGFKGECPAGEAVKRLREGLAK